MTVLLLRRPQPTDLDAERAINDFQGETAELIGRPYPWKARMTVWVLAGMLGSLLVLGGTVGVDRVVMAQGRVVSKSPTIVVQPLETSIIRSIDVHVGQTVRRGDVLATLDPTFTTADVAQVQAKIQSLEAEIARLQAEADGKPFMLADTDTDNADAVLQASIWKYRQAEYKAKLANFDQRIETAQATITRSREDARYYQSRREILTKVETMRQELERNQVGSRLNSLQAADTRIEVERNLALSDATIRTASHDMGALRAERDAYVQQWRSETLTNLVTRRTELSQAAEEMAKAQKRRDLVALRAVEDAVVLDIGHFSVGSVVEGARQLITLMPVNAKLEVEAEINTADQGSVKLGDEVQVKFEAYRYLKYGMGKGVVRTISEDAFTQRDDGSQQAKQPFYRSRIELTEVALRDVPENFRLIPGMPVVADIMVGKRTILSYLMEGVMKNVSEGAREP
ncbi:HlyD family type I secretion periplasmic adaptor subunit (plasmid) [Azospirillum argentinense]|uniref:Membrane fusion protein (MFP) family protein n=1 Tax=Azospirillum argentinense TaxID=2970906 RepID=A0A4D8PPE8_9PROT|nr:HlyD family type I secretion periplasmic adaptor subunit [Azospirillum argentinense]QCO00384.1 HlyD family type I secretion periplasmic adaptor subunit [Azospirillum argentinense]